MNTFEGFISQGESSIEKTITENIEQDPDDYAVGGTHELYSISECPDIVVKRVKPKAEIIARCNGSETKAIQRLKEEHAYVATYLSGFVPKTVFMESDLGKGKEWFMVQERAQGVEFWLLEFEQRQATAISEKLKEEFNEFKARYKRMRNSGKAPEDQVMIDFDNGKIWVYDTNVLRSNETMMNADSLFDLLKDRPVSGKAEDVWSFLQKHFSSAKKLDIHNRNSFLKNIAIPGETYMALLEEVKTLTGTQKLDLELMLGVQRICNGLSYFPPADFEDNIFTLRLAEKLKV